MTIEANWHPAKDIFVAEITASGTGVVEDGVTYYPHAWVERELSTTGRGYGEKAGARTGTVTSHPAFTLDGTALDAGTLVFMRQRGWVNATSISGDVYDIVSVSVVVPGSSSGGGGGGGNPGIGEGFSGCRVYTDGSETGTSDSGISIRWTGAHFDTDHYWVQNDPTTDYRIYVPSAGWYMVGINGRIGRLYTPLPGSFVSLLWRAPGMSGPGSIAFRGTDQLYCVDVCCLWYMPAGAYFYCWAPQPVVELYQGGDSSFELWVYRVGIDLAASGGMLGSGPMGDVPMSDSGPAESSPMPDTPRTEQPARLPLEPNQPYQSPPWSPRVDAMGGDMLGDDSMTGGVTRVIFPNEGAAFLDYTGTPPGGSGGGDFSVNTVYVPPPTWEDFISISSVLPGTYRVTAILTATAEISSTAPAWIHMRIYDSTGSAALGNPARIVTCHTANDEYTDCSTLHFDFTITATSTIKLQVKIDDAGHSPTFTTALILNSGDDVPTYFLRRIFDDE